MRPYPVKFLPVIKQRIWGGEKLKPWFNIKKDGIVGEYWVLSCHPSGISIVENGPLAGKTLIELTKELPEAYLGCLPQKRFPLLIKFLEAKNDLSVQIHPNDEYASKVENDFGKTEAWYILDAKKNSKIVYGHSFKNKREYKQAIKDKKVRNFLKYKDIKKDQVVYVPSCTLHALLAGTVVIEIQQTSDVTYRVYDWDRVNEKGKARELHIDKAADVMFYNKTAMEHADIRCYDLLNSNKIVHQHLLTCPHFCIEKLTIKGKDQYTLKMGKEGNPDILIVIRGEGFLINNFKFPKMPLKRCDTVLIPSSIRNYEVKTDKFIEVLRVYY